jgi:hypothetical protein
LVAHYFGVVGVVGSNPAAPIYGNPLNERVFCCLDKVATLELWVIPKMCWVIFEHLSYDLGMSWV